MNENHLQGSSGAAADPTRAAAPLAGTSAQPAYATAHTNTKPKEILMHNKLIQIQVETPESVALSKIRPWDLNPRSDYQGSVASLAQNMKDIGVLQPIKLRRRPDGNYEVVFGMRRFKALQEVRGLDGVLHAGEFTLVAWDDQQCIRAAISENTQRQDLAPVEEGRFLNTLASHLEKAGEKVTDNALSAKTGIDRPRVSDLRALANKFDRLPRSWQEQLSRPADCRSGDNQTTLTAAHWKVVRACVRGDQIPEDVLVVMEEAVRKGWTSGILKKELAGRKERAKTEKAAPATVRNPEAEPNYKKALQALLTARRWTGKDVELTELSTPI